VERPLNCKDNDEHAFSTSSREQFFDKHGKGLKPAMVQDCVRHGVNGEISVKNCYNIRLGYYLEREKEAMFPPSDSTVFCLL
jgi:hypothetical protein